MIIEVKFENQETYRYTNCKVFITNINLIKKKLTPFRNSSVRKGIRNLKKAFISKIHS